MAKNKYTLNLSAVIDSKSIKKELEKIKKGFKLGLEVDDKGVKAVGKELEKGSKSSEKLQQKLALANEQMKKMEISAGKTFKDYNKGGKQAVEQTKKLEREMEDISKEMQKQISLTDKLDKATTKSLLNRQQLANKQLQTMKASNVSNVGFGMPSMGELGSMASKVLSFGGVTAAIGAIKLAIEEGIKSINEMDSSMIELSKVSSATTSELKEFEKASYDIADGLGATATQIVDAVAEFSRMGYTLKESKDLGELATIMTNVADGIEDTGEAAQTVTGILKGFNLGVDDANQVLDIINHTSNNNAVSFKALADVMKASSSAMVVANTDLAETAGLATAALEVLGTDKASSVSRALNTMSIRIQSSGEEFEKMTGIATSVDGEFRSMYDIVGDLSGVWGTLNDTQKMNIAELIAG